jgi:hypothetical protein
LKSRMRKARKNAKRTKTELLTYTTTAPGRMTLQGYRDYFRIADHPDVDAEM